MLLKPFCYGHKIYISWKSVLDFGYFNILVVHSNEIKFVREGLFSPETEAGEKKKEKALDVFTWGLCVYVPVTVSGDLILTAKM